MENPTIGNQEEVSLTPVITDAYQIQKVSIGTLTAKSYDSRLTSVVKAAVKPGKHLFLTGKMTLPLGAKICLAAFALVPSIWVFIPQDAAYVCIASKGSRFNEGDTIPESCLHEAFYPKPVEAPTSNLSDTPPLARRSLK